MADTKKKVVKEENKAADKLVDIKTSNGKVSLMGLTTIVNAVADSVFIERNGRVEFAAELYEVLLAYWKIGAFYPDTEVLENSLDLFFIDYIDGKYYRELGELSSNRLAQYIENAVEQKVEAKKRQIEDPLINSLTKLVDAATILANKYVDDIDNVGAGDIKKFIDDFGGLVQKTDSQSIAEAVIKLREAAENDCKKPFTAKKRSSRSKKSEQGAENGG